MADTPIAKIEDVEDRLGYTIQGEDKRIRMQALLADASGAIRAYCGRPFASGPVTLRVRSKGGVIRLGAATSVTSVTLPTSNPPGAVVPYQFDGLDQLRLWPAVYATAFDWEYRGMPAVVDVAFVAEDDTPDAVLAICCQMAMRAYGVRPEDSGKQQEAIAGYSYSTGTSAASGGVGMLPDERAVLDQFRNVGATRVARDERVSFDAARDVANLIERLLTESGEVASADTEGMMVALYVHTLDGDAVLVEVTPR